MLAVSKPLRIFLALIAVCSWTGMIIQGYFQFTSKSANFYEKLIRFFSYFTILTNLIVAVCCTVLVINPASSAGRFFSRVNVLTAITVYIVIVGLIYNLILLSLSNFQGWQVVGDVLVHTVTPILFFFFWILLVPKKTLRWKDAWPWLIYPGVYIIMIMIRGARSGFYPYPFLNVSVAGYQTVLLNEGIIAVTILLFSLLFIGTGKMMAKK